MLASYRVHEISSRDALTPGLSVLRTKVFRSLIACKTFYRQTCAKTSPILLFWPCSITASHSKTVSQSGPLMKLTHIMSKFFRPILWLCPRDAQRVLPQQQSGLRAFFIASLFRGGGVKVTVTSRKVEPEE